MPKILETTVDKFTFRVPTDRVYSPDGLWLLGPPEEAGGRIRIGLADYLQQHAGDVAFAGMEPAGTRVAVGDEIGTVETIKTTLALQSPLDGVIVEGNPALKTAPEVINQDPYGEGWLAVMDVPDWEAQKARLLAPEAYLAHMKAQAEAEVTSL